MNVQLFWLGAGAMMPPKLCSMYWRAAKAPAPLESCVLVSFGHEFARFLPLIG